MRSILILTMLVLAAAVLGAQNIEVDTNTPEGQLLQQIGTEEDLAKKVALLEQFAQQYPKHEGARWVLGQLPPAYVKLNQPDKALAAGEKLIQAEPTNVAVAHSMLKIAEEKKDPDLIKKWAVLTHQAAKKVVDAPAPKFEDKDQEQEWKQSVDFAKQVGTYAEYSLHAAVLQTTEPAKKIELADALKQTNPESQYLPAVIPQVFVAYRQMNNAEKAVATAEEYLAKNPTNEDMLLVTADYYMNTKKDAQKTLTYSTKLVELMQSKPAPQGVAPADWEKKKKQMLGVGNWMTGVTYSTQSKFVEADKALREAVPLVEDNPALLAPALFHLGLANYKLGEKNKNDKLVLEAFNLFKRCAAIKSPFQQMAQKNLAAIQSQYHMK